MTQEDEKLIIIDLAPRIPYKVIGQVTFNRSPNKPCKMVINGKMYDRFARVQGNWYDNVQIIPYLRPLSAMTGDEIYSVAGKVIQGLPYNIDETKGTCSVCCHTYTDEIEQDFSVQDLANGIYGIEGLDWLNEHHFDYRGLIKKGLALEAPENMYTKNE